MTLSFSLACDTKLINTAVGVNKPPYIPSLTNVYLALYFTSCRNRAHVGGNRGKLIKRLGGLLTTNRKIFSLRNGISRSLERKSLSKPLSDVSSGFILGAKKYGVLSPCPCLNRAHRQIRNHHERRRPARLSHNRIAPPFFSSSTNNPLNGKKNWRGATSLL